MDLVLFGMRNTSLLPLDQLEWSLLLPLESNMVLREAGFFLPN